MPTTELGGNSSGARASETGSDPMGALAGFESEPMDALAGFDSLPAASGNRGGRLAAVPLSSWEAKADDGSS